MEYHTPDKPAEMPSFAYIGKTKMNAKKKIASEKLFQCKRRIIHYMHQQTVVYVDPERELFRVPQLPRIDCFQLANNGPGTKPFQN